MFKVNRLKVDGLLESHCGRVYLPHLLSLSKNLSTFHAQESEHGEYCEQGARCVCDDVRQGVVAWYEEDVENGGCREITGEQTRGVGKQSCSRVQDGQAEEGDRPHAVEDLKADKAGECEEREGEGEEHHLAGDQHHHPPHQELLPAKLVVQPLGDQLDVPARHLPHLGLHLPGELLVHHRHLHPTHQLGRGTQPGGPLLRLRRHLSSIVTLWSHSQTISSLLTPSLTGRHNQLPC